MNPEDYGEVLLSNEIKGGIRTIARLGIGEGWIFNEELKNSNMDINLLFIKDIHLKKVIYSLVM